jgi:hypothetical protein
MAATFRGVIQALAVLVFVLAACSKRELGGDPPVGGLGGGPAAAAGATGQGGAGGPGAPGGAVGSGGAGITVGAGGLGGASGPGGTGGVPKVVSGCIFNESGTPVPIVDILDPGPVAVACQGTTTSDAVIRVGDARGQGFNWQASVVPSASAGIFHPSFGGGAACAGYDAVGVGVVTFFPDDAVGGSTASGTLVIETTYAGLPWVGAPVSAILVPVQFSLELTDATAVPPGTATQPLVVDFGAVPGDVYVLVRNLGTAPLGLIHPAVPLPQPFSFTDWAFRGEDAPPPPPVAPGETAQIRLGFRPTAPGTYTADLELTPFRSTPGAGCGSPVHVLLSGSAPPGP